MASSRVGIRIATLLVGTFLGLYKRRSRMGTINAAVFPEPVTAPPTTSLPNNATGIVFAWIGVGCENPTDARPRWMGLDRDIDWNDKFSPLAGVFAELSSGAKNASRRAAS